MQEFNIAETLGFQIAQVAKSHKYATNKLLKEIDLHVGQEMVLTKLASKPDISFNELADFLKVTAPTITKVVKGLEGQGLILIKKDEIDKRVSRLRLSEKGNDKLVEIERVWKLVEDETFQSFSIEEKIINE